MDFFSIIQDGVCLIYQAGVYKQAEVYHRGKSVYARVGSGYALLCGHNATSHPKIIWKEIKAEGVKVEGNSAPVFRG